MIASIRRIHTFEPTNVRARISAPTSTMASTTISTTPPGDTRGKPPHVHDEDGGRHDRDDRQDDGEQLAHQYGVALKTKLTGLVSVPLMVTSWLWLPNCSCHAVTVYLPGGSPDKLNAPSSPVTA